MADPVQLKIADKPKANEELVKELEDLLEKARAGEYVTMVAVMIHPGGGFSTIMTRGESIREILGSLAIVQHDVLHAAKTK